jgi:hypothetical protein
MQRNVTLEISTKLAGKPFPCPICGMLLPMELDKNGKLYCKCNICGLQLFCRGQAGIRRLQELLRSEKPIPQETAVSNHGVALYNRLTQLKQKREELEERQGLFIKDRDLANAIAALDGEINRLQLELERIGKKAEKRK